MGQVKSLDELGIYQQPSLEETPLYKQLTSCNYVTKVTTLIKISETECKLIPINHSKIKNLHGYYYKISPGIIFSIDRILYEGIWDNNPIVFRGNITQMSHMEEILGYDDDVCEKLQKDHATYSYLIKQLSRLVEIDIHKNFFTPDVSGVTLNECKHLMLAHDCDLIEII